MSLMGLACLLWTYCTPSGLLCLLWGLYIPFGTKTSPLQSLTMSPLGLLHCIWGLCVPSLIAMSPLGFLCPPWGHCVHSGVKISSSLGLLHPFEVSMSILWSLYSLLGFFVVTIGLLLVFYVPFSVSVSLLGSLYHLLVFYIPFRLSVSPLLAFFGGHTHRSCSPQTAAKETEAAEQGKSSSLALGASK